MLQFQDDLIWDSPFALGQPYRSREDARAPQYGYDRAPPPATARHVLQDALGEEPAADLVSGVYHVAPVALGLGNLSSRRQVDSFESGEGTRGLEFFFGFDKTV